MGNAVYFVMNIVRENWLGAFSYFVQKLWKQTSRKNKSLPEHELWELNFTIH